MNELEQFLAPAGTELHSSLARALCGFLEDCDPEPDGATDAAFATLAAALNAWTTQVHHCARLSLGDYIFTDTEFAELKDGSFFVLEQHPDGVGIVCFCGMMPNMEYESISETPALIQ